MTGNSKLTFDVVSFSPHKCRLGQSNNYKIGICCFSAKHTTLRRKRKERLARNQDNLSEWADMFTRGLLFQ